MYVEDLNPNTIKMYMGKNPAASAARIGLIQSLGRTPFSLNESWALRLPKSAYEACLFFALVGEEKAMNRAHEMNERQNEIRHSKEKYLRKLLYEKYSKDRSRVASKGLMALNEAFKLEVQRLVAEYGYETAPPEGAEVAAYGRYQSAEIVLRDDIHRMVARLLK